MQILPIELSLLDPADLTTKVEMKVEDSLDGGLFLSFKGYEDGTNDEFAKLIKIDFFDGELSVVVWGDKNNEDYTHKISLKDSEKNK